MAIPAETDTDLREQAVEYTLAANPLVGIRDQEIYDASFKLLEQVVTHPSIAAKHYVSWLGELGRIAAGDSALAPDTKDKRFSDAVWKDSVSWRAGADLSGLGQRPEWLRRRCEDGKARRRARALHHLAVR